MELQKTNHGKSFVTVLSDGKFHQGVPEGTEGSVTRDYETKTGEKGTKTELIFSQASGYITKVFFEDGKFGKNIHIEMDGNGVISLATFSSFGEDFMKKLPNIDMDSPVVIAPYSFTDDKGKQKKGITIYQNGAKVENYYFDPIKKKPCNGIPEAEGDIKKFDSDDWKMHFMKVRKFLISEVEKIIGEDNFSKNVTPSKPSNPKEYDEDEIPVIENDDMLDVKDIPF